MIFKVYNPTPALADIVEYYWYSKIESTTSAIQHYPTPLLQGLAFNFHRKEEQHAYNGKTIKLYKQAYFFGQPTSPRVITTNETGVDILCVKFKPLGIAKITGINMEHIADSFIAAEDVWGNELELLCDEMQSAPCMEASIQVLEKFLINKYLRICQSYQAINVSNLLTLIEQSMGNIHIKDLQYQTNTSRKTLERNFIHQLGLKPKLYTQIVRFNAAKDFLDKRIIASNLSGLAYDFGFYNGSHFAAEFKRFSGLTPKQYSKSKAI